MIRISMFACNMRSDLYHISSRQLVRRTGLLFTRADYVQNIRCRAPIVRGCASGELLGNSCVPVRCRSTTLTVRNFRLPSTNHTYHISGANRFQLLCTDSSHTRVTQQQGDASSMQTIHPLESSPEYQQPIQTSSNVSDSVSLARNSVNNHAKESLYPADNPGFKKYVQKKQNPSSQRAIRHAQKLPQMVRRAARKGDYSDVVHRIDLLLSSSELTSKEASYAINTFKTIHQPDKCFEVLEYLKRSQLVTTAAHYNPAIVCLERTGDFEGAYKLYKEMADVGVSRDLITYNTMMAAFAQQRRWDDVRAVQASMELDRIAGDNFTLNILADTAAEIVREVSASRSQHAASTQTNDHKPVSRAEKLAVQSQDENITPHMEIPLPELVSGKIATSSHVYGTMLAEYDRAGEWAKVIEVVTEMRSKSIRFNGIACQSAISAYAQSGMRKDALSMVKKMHIYGYSCSAAVYNRVLHACDTDGAWRQGLTVLQDMHKRGVSPDLLSYTHAINACDKRGMGEPAIALLQEMSARGVRPDQSIYYSIISACSKGDDWMTISNLVQQMSELSFIYNAATYANAIRVFSTAGRSVEAYDMLLRAVAQGVKGKQSMYIDVLSVCDRDGKWKESLDVLRKMQSKSVPCDDKAYGMAISACAQNGKLEEAMALLRQMQEAIRPTELGTEKATDVYTSIILACRKKRDYQQMFDITAEMADLKIPFTVLTYDHFISACAEGGYWKEAKQLLSVMSTLGKPSSTTLYESLITEYDGDDSVRNEVDELYDDMVMNTPEMNNIWTQLKDNGALDMHGHTIGMARPAVRRLLRLLRDQRSGIRYSMGFLDIDFKCMDLGEDGPTSQELKTRVKEQLAQLEPEVSTSTVVTDEGHLELYVGSLSHWLDANHILAEDSTLLPGVREMFEDLEAEGLDRSLECYETLFSSRKNTREYADKLYDNMVANLPEMAGRWRSLLQTGSIDLRDHSRALAQPAVRRLLRVFQEVRKGVRDTDEIKDSGFRHIALGRHDLKSQRIVERLQKDLAGLTPPIETYSTTTDDGVLLMHFDNLLQWLEANE